MNEELQAYFHHDETILCLEESFQPFLLLSQMKSSLQSTEPVFHHHSLPYGRSTTHEKIQIPSNLPLSFPRNKLSLSAY